MCLDQQAYDEWLEEQHRKEAEPTQPQPPEVPKAAEPTPKRRLVTA